VRLEVDLTPTPETHLDSQGGEPGGTARVSHPRTLDRLSEVFRAMVVTGKYTGYPSRSEARMAVTMHAYMVGVDSEAFAAMALNHVHGISRWYDGRGRRLLDKEWDKARRKAVEGDSPVPEKLKAVRRAAFSTAFPGAAGASEYVVLHGILALAGEVGRIDVDVSVRDAAVYANVSKDTAARAIHRLVQRGWFQQLRGAHALTRQAARYRLRAPTGAPPAPDSSLEVLDLPRADYWVKAGSTALQLFHHLLHRPMTHAELVRATGRSRQAVSKQLRTLQADGLLDRDRHGGWTVTSADTGQLSDRYGWTGAAQARVDRHQAQRAGWDHLVRPTSSWYTPLTEEKHKPPDPPAELP
jgi:predicted transcriptional regulator